MIIEDERTPEQRKTHTLLVVGTDKFLSGWGLAEGGTSYAAWACTREHWDKVFNWVRRRGDQKRVRQVCEPWRPRGKGHAHIYVVGENHPALR